MQPIELTIENISNEDIDYFWITNSYPDILSFESKKFGSVPANSSKNVYNKKSVIKFSLI